MIVEACLNDQEGGRFSILDLANEPAITLRFQSRQGAHNSSRARIASRHPRYQLPVRSRFDYTQALRITICSFQEFAIADSLSVEH
jgi:hypothetical protein